VVRQARPEAARVARRARRGVRWAVVLRGRQHLRDQHEQDDLAGGGSVRSGASARAEGDQQ
jgi:hypothetical protein